MARASGCAPPGKLREDLSHTLTLAGGNGRAA